MYLYFSFPVFFLLSLYLIHLFPLLSSLTQYHLHFPSLLHLLVIFSTSCRFSNFIIHPIKSSSSLSSLYSLCRTSSPFSISLIPFLLPFPSPFTLFDIPLLLSCPFLNPLEISLLTFAKNKPNIHTRRYFPHSLLLLSCLPVHSIPSFIHSSPSILTFLLLPASSSFPHLPLSFFNFEICLS